MLKPITIAVGILSMALIGCSSNQKVETQDSKIFTAKSDMKKKMELPKKVAIINFDFDSSKIITQEKHHLRETLDALNKVRGPFVIVIKGHTDKIGSTEYNQKLGLKRAKSVKDALIARGVEDVRIETISYGEERPAIEASNSYERSKNRRASIEIVPANQNRTNKTISMNQ